MTRVNLILLLACVICALGAVTAQHQARKVFQSIEHEQERSRYLDVEFGQLQLELSTWATSQRIEKIAREHLKMQVPAPTKVLLSKVRGDAL